MGHVIDSEGWDWMGRLGRLVPILNQVIAHKRGARIYR